MTDVDGPIFCYAGLESTEAGRPQLREYLTLAARMMGAMRATAGCLWAEAAHNGMFERAILSWWSDRTAIEAWYEHPAHREIVAYGYQQQNLLLSGVVKTWIEFYEQVSSAEINKERAALLVGGGFEADGCVARRSLRTTTARLEFTWVEPSAIVAPHGLILRQLEWGVRTAEDAGAPFSKARVLDFGSSRAKLSPTREEVPTMSQRASDLAKRLRQANDSVIATVESLSEDRWQGETDEEGWTVAATAHHVGATYGLVPQLVQAIASGASVPPLSMDVIDQGNAQHAKEFASCDRGETIALLQNGCESTAAMIEGLSDEQLDRSAQLLQEGPVLTTEQVIEGILISHAEIHGASIKGAL